jgi:hypothetical protein
MRFVQRLVGGVISEISFVLGAAVITGAAGAVVALLTPSMRPLPPAADAIRPLLAAGTGFGFGWWGGLVWAVALALHRHGYPTPPPVAAATRATWIAAGLFAAVTMIGFRLGASFVESCLAGVLVGTLAARIAIGAAAQRAAR